MVFDWKPNDFGGFSAEMPDNVTCVVTPDRLAKGFAVKPARGTLWRAQCSHWDERTRTLSRFGEDRYGDLLPTAKSAMAAAEQIYRAAANDVR